MWIKPNRRTVLEKLGVNSSPERQPTVFPRAQSQDSYEQPERGMVYLRKTWRLKNGDAGFYSGTGVSWFSRVGTWIRLLKRGRKVVLPKVSLSLSFLKLCWLGLGCKPMPVSVNSKRTGPAVLYQSLGMGRGAGIIVWKSINPRRACEH